jgi:hypothetical protein
MKTYLQKHNKISYSDHWSTPEVIYNHYVMKLGYHDPCPLYENGFLFNFIDKPIFLNPPYSDMTRWIEWVIDNFKRYHKPVTILIPARTDTKYFHRLLECKPDIEFIKGRLKFGGSKNSAPFPSLLVHLMKK